MYIVCCSPPNRDYKWDGYDFFVREITMGKIKDGFPFVNYLIGVFQTFDEAKTAIDEEIGIIKEDNPNRVIVMSNTEPYDGVLYGRLVTFKTLHKEGK